MHTRVNGRIVFSFDGERLVKDFLETGHNLVPIATGNDGHTLMEERSRIFPFVDDPDEVTASMMARLWKAAYAEVSEELEMLLPRSVAEGSTQISNMSLAVKDDNLYNEHDIEALDRFIHERLVLAALKAWFRMAESGDSGGLVARVEDNIESLRKGAAPMLRRMALVLHRKVLRNPFSISVDVEDTNDAEADEEQAQPSGDAIGPDYAPWTWHWPWPWNRN